MLWKCVIFLELSRLLRICSARISLIFIYFFAGCSTAVLGNKVALFRTWQAALQLCLGMGLIWLELGRYPHSNAAIISFIRLQFGSLLCSHVAGIRLDFDRLLCSYAVRIRLICLKLGKLLYNHFVGIHFTCFELGRLIRNRGVGIRLICLWHGRCSAVMQCKYVIFLELGKMLRSCAAKVSLIVYNLAGRSTAVLKKWFGLIRAWQAAPQLRCRH